MLPAVHVLTIDAQQEGSALNGSFTMLNNEESSIGGLQYAMEVRSADGEVLFDRVSERTPVALSGKQTIDIPFSYPIRPLPKADYIFRIQIVTTNGRELGWHEVPFVPPVATEFVSLTSAALELPEFNQSIDDPLLGPNVSTGATFYVLATAKNEGTETVSVTPTVSAFTFDAATGDVVPSVFDPMTLAPGQTKILRYAVKASTKPEVYDGVLILKNTDGVTVSSVARYRWVVRGRDAVMMPLRVTKWATAKGEKISVEIAVAGAADAETYDDATVTIELSDENGIVAEGTTPVLHLTDALAHGILDISLNRSLGNSLILRSIVTATDGMILDDQTVSLPVPDRRSFSFSLSPVAILIALFAAVLTVSIGAQFLHRRRRA